MMRPWLGRGNAELADWDGVVANPGAFERKIEVTRARMTPTDVVLDIGCGTGSLALRLASSAAAVHGLDISGAMMPAIWREHRGGMRFAYS